MFQPLISFLDQVHAMQSAKQRLSALLLISVVFALPAQAKRVKLKIGDEAPKWVNLKGIDDKEHSLKELQKAKAIAVVFICNNCPVAREYEARLSKLANDFAKKGVVVIGINADKTEDLEAMKEYAKKRKLAYDYLRDANQKIAKSYGALLTPEVFLLDKNQQIVYMGAIDDDVRLTGKPERHYLRDAIEAVVAGKVPARQTTRAMGCAIRWK